MSLPVATAKVQWRCLLPRMVQAECGVEKNELEVSSYLVDKEQLTGVKFHLCQSDPEGSGKLIPWYF